MPSQFWSKMTGQGGGQIKKYPKCKKNITKKTNRARCPKHLSLFFRAKYLYTKKK